MKSQFGPVLLLALSTFVGSTVACKAKDDGSGAGSGEQPPKTKSEPAPPDLAPVPDARGLAVLGETPFVLLDSTTSTEAQWTVTDTNIRLRAAFAEGSETAAKRDANVYATVAETKETEIFSCKAMEMAGQPRVEAMLRGDHMHVLCINPPAGENLGFTDAVRLTFSPATVTLVESGSYGGEGIVDPDTIDLDEGEGASEDGMD